ncbi:MAG: hypothetical protein ICV58_09125 [Rubrobacteraceae bacterium]|nr:hypothetical protein [Rubrobacteraceae bacterium]
MARPLAHGTPHPYPYNGTSSFVLLAGVFGILQLLMGMVVRERASRYAAPSQ